MVRVSLTEFPARCSRSLWRSVRRTAAAGRAAPMPAVGGLAVRTQGDGPPVPSGDHTTGGPLPRALVVLLGTASAVVVLGGLRAVAWLVAPVFLALVLVITLDPVRTWLRGKGLPRWLTVAMLVAAVYAALLALFVVIVISVAQLATLLPRYAARIDELTRSGAGTLGRFGVGEPQLRELASSVDTGKLVRLAGSLLAGVGGLVTNLVFLLALLLFLGTESAWAGRRLSLIARDRPWITDSLRSFVTGTRAYLVVTTVFGGIVAVLDTVALAIIGFVIGVAPPALIALLDGGAREMLIVFAVYGLLNFVVQSLIQPRFVAGSVGLSTLVTVLALVFWTWVLGPLGAVLAVPATLLAKALLVDADPRARWADALLSAPVR